MASCENRSRTRVRSAACSGRELGVAPVDILRRAARPGLCGGLAGGALGELGNLGRSGGEVGGAAGTGLDLGGGDFSLGGPFVVLPLVEDPPQLDFELVVGEQLPVAVEAGQADREFDVAGGGLQGVFKEHERRVAVLETVGELQGLQPQVARQGKRAERGGVVGVFVEQPGRLLLGGQVPGGLGLEQQLAEAAAEFRLLFRGGDAQGAVVVLDCLVLFARCFGRLVEILGEADTDFGILRIEL